MRRSPGHCLIPLTVIATLLAALAGCGPAEQASGGGGLGGTQPTAGRGPAGGTGGAGGSGGAGGTGGGGGSGGAGGTGGGAGAGPAQASDAPAAHDARPEAGADVAGPSASGQGPVAEGKIVYSQDFEQNIDGFTPSPTSLPESRYTRVDDPLGQRGKVLKIDWLAGDGFKTSPNNKPRSCVSNTGYQPAVGTILSYAWGYMITSLDINATFAQVIRSGGPIWMIEGHEKGDLIVRRGGGGGVLNINYTLEVNRWYDFRVEMKYLTGAAGEMQVFINGQKVYEKIGLGLGDPPGRMVRWDGGIYNTEIGIANNRSRTVYISNLSIGTK